MKAAPRTKAIIGAGTIGGAMADIGDPRFIGDVVGPRVVLPLDFYRRSGLGEGLCGRKLRRLLLEAFARIDELEAQLLKAR